MKALTDPLEVVLLPVAGIVSKGVAVAETAAFLDTDTGAKYISSDVLVRRLLKGDIMWIPYGFAALPTLIALGENNKTEARPAWAIVWNVCVSEMAVNLDASTWKAIESWNADYHALQGDSKLWRHRAATFKALIDGVQKEMSRTS